MAEFDVVVLGGGTGGYVAAIRGAQLGLKVAVVDKGKLGGTCLHTGCIPSKSLLRSAEVYHTLKHAKDYGLVAEGVSVDWPAVQARKNRIVQQLHKGVEGLLKKAGVAVFMGTGTLLPPSIFAPSGAVSIKLRDGGEEMLTPQHIVLATGSRAKTLPGLDIDGRQVLTSDEALELERLPKSMIVIGGGVIGCEWASLLSDFGVKVTILEYLPQLLPAEEPEVAAELSRNFQRRGIKVHTGARVDGQSLARGAGEVSVEAEVGGRKQVFSAEQLLVAVGRAPNVEAIGLDNLQVKLERGFVTTDGVMRTSKKGVYAIGDMVGTLQLAHVAMHQGIVAMEHIAGQNPQPLDYDHIPRVTYSRPEVASVGVTEAVAKERGREVRTGKFPFRAIGKALVFGEWEGFVKVVADARTNDLLGVHMIGPHVSDLISAAGLALVLNATPWEVGHLTVHPHPTLAEAFGEASLAALGAAIHV